MLITFDATGAVEFTRDPETLKLFDGEHLSIKRMTEIEFDEELQRYTFRFILGRFAGLAMQDMVAYSFNRNCAMASRDKSEHIHGSDLDDLEIRHRGPEFLWTFPTYESAVKAELYVVDKFRARGYTMHE